MSQPAVNPKSHASLAWTWFEMNVRRSRFGCGNDEATDETHDRLFACHVAQAICVFVRYRLRHARLYLCPQRRPRRRSFRCSKRAAVTTKGSIGRPSANRTPAIASTSHGSTDRSANAAIVGRDRQNSGGAAGIPSCSAPRVRRRVPRQTRHRMECPIDGRGISAISRSVKRPSLARTWSSGSRVSWARRPARSASAGKSIPSSDEVG